MAEAYQKMDKSAADGMKTSEDKTAAVTAAWERVRSDATPAVEWAIFGVEGKSFALKSEGAGTQGMLDALDEADVNFGGFRVSDGGATKFYHLLYVGSGVGIIKKNKAQMQKNAPFNAMPGTAGDVELPQGEKTAEKLAALISAV